MKVVNNPEHCADESVTAHERGNVNNVRIDLGGPTLAIIMVLVAIIGSCGVVMGVDMSDRHAQSREFDRRAQQAQREADRHAAELTQQMKDVKTQEWLKERRLMDAEAYMIANGLKTPADDNFGPTGNIQRMRRK